MTTNIFQTPIDITPSKSEKFRTRVLPFIALAIALIVIPFLGPSRTAFSLMNIIGINIVFALSLNMLLGHAGLLSFGHAVYFGFGGYGALHVMNWIEQAGTDGGLWASYPVFALPIIGFGCGALAGAVIGWPSCRRAGVPFAMISLGIAELVASGAFIFTGIFGGEEGISGDRMNGVQMFGLSLGPVARVYWFIAFWTFVGVVGMYVFTRTPLGRLTQAVRDNPERVEFVGYNPQSVRYLTFVASGGFAGLAGGMAAINFEIFTPEALSLVPSGFVLLMTYIGGTRYFAGPILGAIVLTYMQSNLSDYTEGWLLYMGLLFILVVMYAPAGLAGIVKGGYDVVFDRDAREKLTSWLYLIVGGIVAFVGTVVVIEVTVRHTNGFGEIFEPFGMRLRPDAVFTWVIALGLLLAGVFVIRWVLKTRGEQ